MNKTRVLLCTLPTLMRQIIRDLVDRQPDMEIVGEVATLAGLPQAIESCRADAVIVTLSPQDAPEIVSALRRRHPRVLIMSFADDRQGPVLWPWAGRPRAVEASGAAVVDALRQRHENVLRASHAH